MEVLYLGCGARRPQLMRDSLDGGAMRFRTKRIYDGSDSADGQRVLVDRLWPRGVSKSAARIDYWAKSVAPSTPLRRWYGHDPAKWKEFRRRYFAELAANPEGLADLRRHLGKGTVTLLYGSREEHMNDATALREFLERGLKRRRLTSA